MLRATPLQMQYLGPREFLFSASRLLRRTPAERPASVILSSSSSFREDVALEQLETLDTFY